MNGNKLINVRYVHSNELTPEFTKELGVQGEKGLIAIETRIMRETSHKEVEEICKLYNDGFLAKAIDKYEDYLLELANKLK